MDATFSQQGTVSKLGGPLQIKDGPLTTPKAETSTVVKAIEDAKPAGDPKPGKPKKLTKDELKAALEEEQRKEEEKKAKAAQPLERGKTLLRKCPVAIRELSVAQNDLKVPAIKKCMPPRFYSEYTHALASHMQVLNNIRQQVETSMCKDEKIFAKKMGESMEAGEKELEQTAMTLKAWKNSLHVYGGTKHSSSSKPTITKISSAKPTANAGGPSGDASSTAEPPKKKRKA